MEIESCGGNGVMLGKWSHVWIIESIGENLVMWGRIESYRPERNEACQVQLQCAHHRRCLFIKCFILPMTRNHSSVNTVYIPWLIIGGPFDKGQHFSRRDRQDEIFGSQNNQSIYLSEGIILFFRNVV